MVFCENFLKKTNFSSKEKASESFVRKSQKHSILRLDRRVRPCEKLSCRAAHDGLYQREFIKLLIMDRHLSAELELTKEQRSKLKALYQRPYSKAEMEEFEKIRNEILEKAKRQEAEGRKVDTTRLVLDAVRRFDSKLKKLEKILLPHQQKRFKEIFNRVRYRIYNGPYDFELVLKSAKELNISDSDKKKLEKKITAITTNLDNELYKLEADIFRQLLKGLSKKQRRDYDKKIGKIFDFEKMQQEIAASKASLSNPR